MKGSWKHYCWIDFTKLFLCFCVVAVHVSYVFPACPDSVLVWMKGVVPVYFVISGFVFGQHYLYSPISERGNIMRKSVKRILELYLLWTIVYSPIALIYLLNHHTVGMSILLYLRNVLLVGENMMSWHLWYLHALLVAILIIHIMLSFRFKMWFVVIISTLLFCLGLYIVSADNAFIRLYNNIFCNTQNGIFCGAFYVSLGMLLSFYKEKLNWLLPGIFLPLSILVYNLDIPFYYPMFSIGFVSLLLRFPHQSLFPAFSSWARNASSIIYFSHFLPIVFMQQIMHWQGEFLESFLIILPICIVFAWLCLILSKISQLSFLNKLY